MPVPLAVVPNLWHSSTTAGAPPLPPPKKRQCQRLHQRQASPPAWFPLHLHGHRVIHEHNHLQLCPLPLYPLTPLLCISRVDVPTLTPYPPRLGHELWSTLPPPTWSSMLESFVPAPVENHPLSSPITRAPPSLRTAAAGRRSGTSPERYPKFISPCRVHPRLPKCGIRVHRLIKDSPPPKWFPYL